MFHHRIVLAGYFPYSLLHLSGQISVQSLPSAIESWKSPSSSPQIDMGRFFPSTEEVLDACVTHPQHEPVGAAHTLNKRAARSVGNPYV